MLSWELQHNTTAQTVITQLLTGRLLKICCGTTGSASMDAKAQISDQAKRYGDVVCNVNKALVGASQDQFDAVKAFLDACPEEDKGQHCTCMTTTLTLVQWVTSQRAVGLIHGSYPCCHCICPDLV